MPIEVDGGGWAKVAIGGYELSCWGAVGIGRIGQQMMVGPAVDMTKAIRGRCVDPAYGTGILMESRVDYLGKPPWHW